METSWPLVSFERAALLGPSLTLSRLALAAQTHASNADKALIDRLNADWTPSNPSARTPGVWSSPPPSSPSIPGTDIRRLFSTSSHARTTPITSPTHRRTADTRDEDTPAPSSPLAGTTAVGSRAKPSLLTATFAQTDALRKQQEAAQRSKKSVEEEAAETERANKKEAEMQQPETVKAATMEPAGDVVEAMEVDEEQQQAADVTTAAGTELLQPRLTSLILADPTRASSEARACPRSPAASTSASLSPAVDSPLPSGPRSLVSASSTSSTSSTSIPSEVRQIASADLQTKGTIGSLLEESARSSSPLNDQSTMTAEQPKENLQMDGDGSASGNDKPAAGLGAHETRETSSRAR